MVTVNDQIGRVLRFNKLPKRIVSLVPSQTELLCDLGLEHQVVGVTKFCVHPGHIKGQSTIVGGTKQIHLDKIRELQPDIILCNKEENTKAIVEACEAICPVHVSDIFTVDDSVELIKQYGALFDRQTKAEELTLAIRKKLDEFNRFIETHPLKKVAYFIWKNPWMVAANNTFINHLLKLNKFENIYGHLARYPCSLTQFKTQLNSINFH
nr:helical backbone metal receptor [Tamlana crocina]